MKEEKAQAQKEIAQVKQKEEELEQETATYQEILDEKLYLEGSAGRSFSEAQMEESNIRQKSEFAASNIERVKEEIEKCGIQIQKLSEEAELAKEDVKQREQQIDHIRQTIRSSEDEFVRFEEILQKKQGKVIWDFEPAEGIWQDRPSHPDRKNFSENGKKLRRGSVIWTKKCSD